MHETSSLIDGYSVMRAPADLFDEGFLASEGDVLFAVLDSPGRLVFFVRVRAFMLTLPRTFLF